MRSEASNLHFGGISARGLHTALRANVVRGSKFATERIYLDAGQHSGGAVTAQRTATVIVRARVNPAG
jgi:hypothetical protein